MTIMHGLDSSQKIIPLLLDASGNVIVSASQLTTTGGKLHVDANGDIIPDMDSITTTGGKFHLDSDGDLYIRDNFPHSVWVDGGVTQVIKYNFAVNQTTIIHTVTSGKTLYLTSFGVNCYNGSGGAQTTYFRIRDTSDVEVVSWTFTINNGASVQNAFPFVVPITIPAGYDLVAISTVALYSIYVAISGYEK